MALRNVSSVLKAPVIPKRIPRSKTDILKALSGTVGLDSTAPQHVYIDDPYLAPANLVERSVFALSKESGIKAAKHFFEKYPHLFHRDLSEPKIEAFTYKEVYDDTMDLNEADLLEAIEKNQVTNAEFAYKQIVAQKKPLSDDAKVRLIQCSLFFYDGEPQDSDLRIKAEAFGREETKPVRTDVNMVLDIFDTIENKDGVAYSALIVGLSRAKHYEKVRYFLKQSLENNIPLTTEGFNVAIQEIQEPEAQRVWEEILSYFTKMAEANVSPSVETLNSSLDVISRINSPDHVRRNYAGKIMAEMKQVSIEPDLVTYYLLLKIFCEGRNADREVFEDILYVVENQTVDFNSLASVRFPLLAMNCSKAYFTDINLAYRVHNIFMRNDYRTLLLRDPYNHKEFLYSFFDFLLKSETIDNVMHTYEKYVPNVMALSFPLVCDLIECVKLYQAYYYLPRLCSDFLFSETVANFDRMLSFVNLLVNLQGLDEKTKNYLTEFASEVISLASKKRQRDIERRMPERANLYLAIHLSCLNLFLSADNLQAADQLVSKISGELNLMEYDGKVRLDDLSNFVNKVLSNQPSLASVRDAITVACRFKDTSVLKSALQIVDEKNMSTQFRPLLVSIANKYNLPVPDTDTDKVKPSQSKSEG